MSEQVTKNAKALLDRLLGSFVRSDPRLAWSPPAFSA
jgi:hypothetical protein